MACMANIIEVLSKYDGVARAKYIAAAGVSDFQLKSAMARGRRVPGGPRASMPCPVPTRS